MAPVPLACHSFLHRITTASGETTSRYSFHEVENVENFAKNNYNS